MLWCNTECKVYFGNIWVTNPEHIEVTVDQFLTGIKFDSGHLYELLTATVGSVSIKITLEKITKK